MTKQLTKSQIDQLRVVLAMVGLDVKKLPVPKAPKAPGISIWAKRRIARSYRGVRTLATRWGAVSHYAGVMLPDRSVYVAHVWNTPDYECRRYSADDSARWLKYATRTPKLLAYQNDRH